MALLDTVTFLSVDAAANRFRFFVLELHVSGAAAEIRWRWGRLGTPGREGAESYESEVAARDAWDDKRSHRVRRGYVEAVPSDVLAARRLLAWTRIQRRDPSQLAFPVAVGF